jgi:Secretion system C-terminal sorting domain
MHGPLRHIILVTALLALHAWCHAQFTGGAGDGHAQVLLASSIPCASYSSNSADGHASAVLPNPDPCILFDGGIADGVARFFLVNPDSCGQYEGGQQDGYGKSVLVNPVPCTSFFSSQRDGHAMGSLPCAPLTVVTSELFGQVTDGDGYLWWYSFIETQNLGFSVERSRDLNEWAEIAFLPGQSSSSDTRKYELWDREMLEGVNYYRWRQLDLAGGHTLSNTVALIKGTQAARNLLLYPNPVGTGSLLHLHFETQDTSALDITLVDALGHVVQTIQLSGAVSPIHHEIATEALSAGMYFLILDQGNTRISRRFVVR